MEENYQLAKWLNNELSPTELEEFKASPDYEIYEKIKKYSQQITVKNFDEEKLLQNILASKKQERKPIHLFNNWIFKIAAVFVLMFGISYFVVNKISTKTEITEANITKTFLLPDQSKVVLKPNSQVKYKTLNWENNRNLNLKGLAYFHVAKGKKFVVSTDLGKVSVMGTQFEVNSQNNSFNVLCYEGKVKVNYQNKETILTKGMQVNFENGTQNNSETNAENPYETDRLMIFKDEKLENIFIKLQKTYNIKIESNIHSQELFTGKIPSNNIDLALSIVASTYKLGYKKTEGKIIFFKKK